MNIQSPRPLLGRRDLRLHFSRQHGRHDVQGFELKIWFCKVGWPVCGFLCGWYLSLLEHWRLWEWVRSPGAWKSLEDLRVFSSLGWPRFQMEAWGNSSGQPLGLDFDSQARWKMCRHGKDGSDDRSDWNYVCFLSFNHFPWECFKHVQHPNKLDPCCRSDLSVWCTGGSLCLWCCTSSDLSDCACWCLSCVAQRLPFSSADGGNVFRCPAATRSREKGAPLHIRSIPMWKSARWRDDEMSCRSWVEKWWVSIWLSIWGLYVVSCRYEQSQFLGPNSLCLSRQPTTQWIDLLSQLGDVVGWQRFNNFRTGMLYFTDSGWRPCLVSMLEKLHNFPFFPCHVSQLFAHLHYPEIPVERCTQSNLIWSRCHGLNINNLSTTTLNIQTSKHTTYQQMNH